MHSKDVSVIPRICLKSFSVLTKMTSDEFTTGWRTTRFELDLSQPKVMGIVNVTPDSFSDGGQHTSTVAVLGQCERLIQQGADILDIGGESTRPGASPVSLAQELDRVLPVVREAVKFGIPISVDTYKPEVMRAVLDLGVDIINDVYALRMPGAIDAVAAYPLSGLCLMHMHREPVDMQIHPMEGDVIHSVVSFLRARMEALEQEGIQARRMVMDSGVGFGKTVEQNFTLMAQQSRLIRAISRPWLSGWSRKSALGAVTGKLHADEREAASIAAAVLSVDRGARIVRVHDVQGTVDALQVWSAEQTAHQRYEDR